MSGEHYPRDMIGYGRSVPRVEWPGGARIAVQFVVNYEEGGENNILHGDDASETFLSEIVGAEPFVGARHMSMESLYEYGSRAGFWRLWRLFAEAGIPVTVFGVAMALARNPEGTPPSKTSNAKSLGPTATHAIRIRSLRQQQPVCGNQRILVAE